jgi:hypothetical protein
VEEKARRVIMVQTASKAREEAANRRAQGPKERPLTEKVKEMVGAREAEKTKDKLRRPARVGAATKGGTF